MSWKKLEKKISALRAKHKGSKYRVEIPSLKVEQNVAPLGNGFAPISGKKSLPKGAKAFPVGILHKSNPMLITEGMVRNDELKYLGGKKS